MNSPRLDCAGQSTVTRSERVLAKVWSPTLRELGLAKLRALSAGLDLSPAQTDRARQLFDLLTAPWSSWRAGHAPPWPNDISDDGSPFEFSLAFAPEATEVRFLVESQRRPITVSSSFDAGLQLNQRLRAEGADLALFEAVQSGFVPGVEPLRFSLWHAAVLRPSGSTTFKAYLNPRAAGAGAVEQTLAQAMLRAGLAAAWASFRARLAAANHLPEFKYFSVDLQEPGVARVKVYFSLRSTELSAVVRCSREIAGMDPSHELSILMDDLDDAPRPILLCCAFTKNSACPELTLHVPIRWAVPHDEEAVRRVSQLVTAAEAQQLRRAAQAIAGRPLEAGRGLLTYASFRRDTAGLRVTVYLSPELYSIMTPRRMERGHVETGEGLGPSQQKLGEVQ